MTDKVREALKRAVEFIADGKSTFVDCYETERQNVIAASRAALASEPGGA
jgi:hypothetical protein